MRFYPSPATVARIATKYRIQRIIDASIYTSYRYVPLRYTANRMLMTTWGHQAQNRMTMTRALVRIITHWYVALRRNIRKNN